MKTVDGLSDAEHKIDALRSIATILTNADKRDAAQEILRSARSLADSLEDRGRKENLQWTIVRLQLETGDLEPALRMMRSHPKSTQVGWVSLDVGRAQLKAGKKAAAVAALQQAWVVGAALQDPHEDPMGVVTLVPRWTLLKAFLIGQTAAALVAAGEESDARVRAGMLESPYIHARALLGIAVGLSHRERKALRSANGTP